MSLDEAKKILDINGKLAFNVSASNSANAADTVTMEDIEKVPGTDSTDSTISVYLITSIYLSTNRNMLNYLNQQAYPFICSPQSTEQRKGLNWN